MIPTYFLLYGVRGHQSAVVPYISLKSIATEQGQTVAGWTNEDCLLQHATGARYKLTQLINSWLSFAELSLSQELLFHKQEDNLTQRHIKGNMMVCKLLLHNALISLLVRSLGL